jgi:hypothetical protein
MEKNTETEKRNNTEVREGFDLHLKITQRGLRGLKWVRPSFVAAYLI